MAKVERMLNKLLLQVAKEQNFINFDLKIKPVSSGGANFSSTLFNVSITEGDKVVHLFVKVAAAGEQLRTQGGSKVYETEIFAYTKLAEVYKGLEEEHQVPEEHRLKFAKFYGCNPTVFEETLVLEDLVEAGYVAFDRFKCFDLKYATSALTELAKMHALSLAYGVYHPGAYIEVIDYVNKRNWVVQAGSSLVGYLETVFATALKNAREETKDKLQRFLEKFDKAAYGDFYRTSGPPVLGHGDFRPSNLMHKVCDDGTVDIKVVDMQTLYGGSPVIDFLYFIFTGSDEQLREQHFETLQDHYYTQLCVSMKRLGLDPDKVYSRENFQSELKEKLVFGLVHSTLILPILLANDTPEVNEELTLSAMAEIKATDLCIERLNGVINDYVKWGILK
ncbi:unnamed protein product [Arctia plantaginis]|uniref:CHK kinase-like domain-containing protein n=1 Tax=Arctia plantaginis TaxID=874455 RepID=A0A8S1AD04_ARCPL|nr:unnamed protein product [Arctia plantaginis]